MFSRNILVTGGAGFIGSHLVRRLVQQYPNYRIVNFDVLSYAGNLQNVADVANAPNYVFEQGDICDADRVNGVFAQYAIDAVIHLAAESHVDRSIENPLAFIDTNIRGTAVLLNAAVNAWEDALKNGLSRRFYQVSTDEVFGALGAEGAFDEQTPYDPRSPYSASKASADHLVRAYGHTYKLPFVISNCSNNYGTHQYPEKLIPVIVRNIAQSKPLPVYGKGDNVRDWLAVEDHVAAIDTIFHNAADGTTYCVGGNNEWKNIDLVREICRIADDELGQAPGTSEQLITFVTDRKGHDFRYAIDASALEHDLGWVPSVDFEEGLRRTIRFYLKL